jgi:hypothetical protein
LILGGTGSELDVTASGGPAPHVLLRPSGRRGKALASKMHAAVIEDLDIVELYVG